MIKTNTLWLLLGAILAVLFACLLWQLFFMGTGNGPICPDGYVYVARDGICVIGVYPQR